MMSQTAFAPSNLALIKYAGKIDQSNLPLNTSFSYTLNHFQTALRISSLPSHATKDQWQSFTKEECIALKPLVLSGAPSQLKLCFFPLILAPSGVKRFLNFFQSLKDLFHISGFFLVKSANNFPMSMGSASSASGFCALTRAVHKIALAQSSTPSWVRKLTPSDLSIISRPGSGSSCRSFFSPFALWEGEGASPPRVNVPFPYLRHQLVLADTQAKAVSSSEAHQRIRKSPFFPGRKERAEKRLLKLLSAFSVQDWRACFEIVWEEFQDLHTLYESARPSIFYRNEASYDILHKIKMFWEQEKDGPLVTMDAGSSVHLLYRPDQAKILNQISLILRDYKIIDSV